MPGGLRERREEAKHSDNTHVIFERLTICWGEEMRNLAAHDEEKNEIETFAARKWLFEEQCELDRNSAAIVLLLCDEMPSYRECCDVSLKMILVKRGKLPSVS